MPAAASLPQPSMGSQMMPWSPGANVHGVKGETHDITVFVCPPPKSAARCPSAAWWPPDGEDHEEKRIAYVAMTRTRGDVVLCVSGDCFRRLSVDRASFVGALESMDR